MRIFIMTTRRLYSSSQTTIRKREGLECVDTPRLCFVTVMADCKLGDRDRDFCIELIIIQALSMNHAYLCLSISLWKQKIPAQRIQEVERGRWWKWRDEQKNVWHRFWEHHKGRQAFSSGPVPERSRQRSKQEQTIQILTWVCISSGIFTYLLFWWLWYPIIVF